jgi:hypothetical protein
VDGRSLDCGAGRGISRAKKFDCDLGQVGPREHPDPSAPPSEAAIENRIHTLKTPNESSLQQTLIGGLVLFPKAQVPFYLE